ncbi:PREDICTED: uncharacterized protein LOC109211931 [Nicotiana attenuata]|uniref:DUF7912 domain-containing protein n=1 Tax=Nicotiana attenuata TaxID=49451 RepID=A0A314KI33_NICAT|nr:PREDICTED: uncharacterized protein LOC109211931 [Nicotiana attenuata]OIT29005.1 hypothetical protein A4A49_16630 [Nicotiana attenuata]
MSLSTGLMTWSPNSAFLPMSMGSSSNSSRISCHTLSNKARRRRVCITVNAKKRSEPVLKPSVVEKVSLVDEAEDGLLLEDEDLVDDDDGVFEEYFEEDAELYVGDGSGGGGISLSGTSWDKRALELAEEVALSFDGELGIYAFKTLKNANIQVRVERLTNKSGTPSMMDIEAFSLRYREKLDEAEVAGSIPNNISLEVSSPGVERVIRIPQDLDRFKDRPMYVKYVSDEVAEGGSSSEHDGVLRLVSFNLETNACIWGIADVRVNREKAGKGKPLSKKQRDWRLETPFTSLRLVRLYSEF